MIALEFFETANGARSHDNQQEICFVIVKATEKQNRSNLICNNR